MRLHSYVLDHDYGFAPNPFFGVCTLATCKPEIRKHATVGDYVVGTGCAKHRRRGFLIYFMRVEEITDFDAYWADPRFAQKRPFRCGSRKQAYGDNIYHRDPNTRRWCQAYSLHTRKDGSMNLKNLRRDTGKTERVLISHDYTYWGGAGPQIPARFRNFGGVDICAKRGHKNRIFSPALIAAFVAWLRSLGQQGFVGRPTNWGRD